jgi:hypothetical protein
LCWPIIIIALLLLSHLVHSWELMMKPATIVILATMTFLAPACTAKSATQPGGPDVPGGRASAGHPGTPAPVTSAGENSGDDAPTTLLLGHLVMRTPASWRVTYSDSNGDYAVSTGSCEDGALLGSMTGSSCPSFSIIAGVSAAAGPDATDRTYSRTEPYHPSSGALGCPGQPGAGWRRLGPSNAYHEGFARVGSGTAYYTVWRIGCGLASSAGAATASFFFEQRDWYLPGSSVLIVDEYSIAGLAAVLADATSR